MKPKHIGARCMAIELPSHHLETIRHNYDGCLVRYQGVAVGSK